MHFPGSWVTPTPRNCFPASPPADIVRNPAEGKYRRVNLGGNAGGKIVAAPACLCFLKSAGFVETADGYLELPGSTSGEGLSPALQVLQAASTAAGPKEIVATAAPAAAAAASAEKPAEGVGDPTAGMSLKQKAIWMQEQKAKQVIPCRCLLRSEHSHIFIVTVSYFGLLQAREAAKKQRAEELAKIDQDKVLLELPGGLRDSLDGCMMGYLCEKLLSPVLVDLRSMLHWDRLLPLFYQNCCFSFTDGASTRRKLDCCSCRSQGRQAHRNLPRDVWRGKRR